MKFYLVLVFWGQEEKQIECSIGYADCKSALEACGEVGTKAVERGIVPVRYAWALDEDGIDQFIRDLIQRTADFRTMHAARIGN
jgi:hypothetical protein